MTPYRESDGYTRQLERDLGEAQKRCERLAWERDQARERAARENRKRLLQSWPGLVGSLGIIAGALGFVAYCDRHSECEAEREVLICAEEDGPCRTLTEAD